MCEVTGFTGTKILGLFSADLPGGLGDITYYHKDRFIGFFKKGKRDGDGNYISSNGAVLTARWAEGEICGDGVKEWPSGAVYEGGFRFEKMDGNGVMTFPSGHQ